MTSPAQILSEFIDAWNGGRRPDVGAFLERASPGEREELAAAIDGWLTFAPAPPYSAAQMDEIRTDPLLVAAREAVGDVWQAAEPLPALLPRLRERAGLSVRGLAEALVAALGLDGREEKTERYLDSLEQGRLDTGRLSPRLIDALARSLGTARERVEDAARAVVPAAPAPAAVRWRAEPQAAESLAEDIELLARLSAAPPPEPWDEVDELFRGGA